MIRVAFTILGNQRWLGGLHYLENLLRALSILDKRRIEPLLFVGEKTNDDLLKMFSPYAIIKASPIFDRNTLPWAAHKFFDKVLGSKHFLNKLMQDNNVSVLSHSSITSNRRPYKLINWIPDFQHLHMPQMYSKEQLRFRNNAYRRTIECSDIVILSSFEALKDFTGFAPEYVQKARVLHFHSAVLNNDNVQGPDELEKRYGFKGKFFYLPNQFWKHKNHKVAFHAVRILKERGKNILLLCSGHMNDHRHKQHMTQLMEYISKHGLHSNIRLLGLIDYSDVVRLIRHSISVVNPSLFEGWSTTVEEARALGKSIILSNINVHREQDPPNGVYFAPMDAVALSDIMESQYENYPARSKDALDQASQSKSQERARRFAIDYENIVLELVSTTS